jgi:hypothetical protein
MSSRPSARPLLCFIHIERAGGTTLQWLLRRNFPTFLTLTPPRRTNDEALILTRGQLGRLLRVLPFTSGIGGHTVRTYAGYESVTERRILYFTFLREPVARFVSHLQYQLGAAAGVRDIAQALEDPYLGNFMTKRIAGAGNLADARRRIDEDYGFVGFQEEFDHSLIALRAALDVPIDLRYERRNRSVAPARWARDPGVLRAAQDLNVKDLELYYFARDRWASRHEGTNLSDGEAAGRLRTASANYRVPTLAKYRWRAYRLFVQRPAERLLSIGP